jgi:hypothetical protein
MRGPDGRPPHSLSGASCPADRQCGWRLEEVAWPYVDLHHPPPLLLPCPLRVTILIFGMVSFLSPVERSALYMRYPRNDLQLQAAIRAYGLNDSVYVQYWH